MRLFFAESGVRPATDECERHSFIVCQPKIAVFAVCKNAGGNRCPAYCTNQVASAKAAGKCH
jgi:hypothetical protein